MPPLCAVRDLEPEELRAGRHAVEPGHAIEVVPRRDAGDVGAVAPGVEEQVEPGPGTVRGEVGREADARPAALGRPAEGLAAHQVIVDRPLARERPIAVGVRQQHPAVGGADHDDRQRVADRAVAVEVGGRRATERQLGDRASVVRPGGVERRDPAEAAEATAADLDRVARRRHAGERDRALAGEVAQVDELRIAGGSGLQARNARIDAGIEDADQDATAVGLGIGTEESVDPVLASGIHPRA